MDQYIYLVLAVSTISDESDYVWCASKEQLKEECFRLEDLHFEICFAGEIKIVEDLTMEILKE